MSRRPAVTLVAVGSRGDVAPYLAIAARLVTAGASVSVATHDRFAAGVTAAGAVHRSITGDPREMMASPEIAHWQGAGADPGRIIRRFRAVAKPRMRAYLDDCVAAVEGADLVLFSALGVGAYHAAEASQIPAWPAFLQPTSPTGAFPSPLVPPWIRHLGRVGNRTSHRVVEVGAWLAFAREVDRFRRLHGLSALGRRGPAARARASGVPHLFGVSRHVVPVPTDWPPGHELTGYWRTPPTGELPARLREFVAAAPPPVYVGFGSRRHGDAAATARVVADAARAAGVRRLVVQPGWGGLDPGVLSAARDLAVFVVEEVDHDTLFPRCAAVVHHGGAGTTAAALLSGTPSLVIPSFGDQFFWAWRSAALGAAPEPVPLRRLRAGRLATALARVVADRQLAEAAHRISGFLRSEDGAGRVVERIDQWLTASRRA